MGLSPRVHILGLGSIGTFAAHCLAETPLRPSITLLLHRESLLDGYTRNGNQISLLTREKSTVGHGDYGFEVLKSGRWYNPQDGKPTLDPIENIILCSKVTQTVDALRPLKHRLTPASTILFLQNGSGMVEEVNKYLFPDVHTRPNYITGVISHGVDLNAPFAISHTGLGATSLGMIRRPGVSGQTSANSYLLDALPTIPRLNATSYSFVDIFQVQLEKLAVNAVCNPLCALNNSKNDFLLTIPEVTWTLLDEISRVACVLPELSGVPGVNERFSTQSLWNTMYGVVAKTTETTASMVWDVRAGRKTEIQFINGYWSRRGRELGVPTPLNDELVTQITEREVQAKMPAQAIPKVVAPVLQSPLCDGRAMAAL